MEQLVAYIIMEPPICMIKDPLWGKYTDTDHPSVVAPHGKLFYFFFQQNDHKSL